MTLFNTVISAAFALFGFTIFAIHPDTTLFQAVLVGAFIFFTSLIAAVAVTKEFIKDERDDPPQR